MQPRPYQAEALKALTRAFDKHESAILALPTGSGKTFVAARWLIEHILKRGRRVVWLAHRRELLDQAYRAFTTLSASMDPRPRVTWYASGRGFDPTGDVVVASVSSARDIPTIAPAIAVVDEAHHEPAATYQHVLERLGAEKKLGLTATPARLDERPLNFETIAFQRTLMDLVREGWLARPRAVVPKTQLEFNVESRAGDVARESLGSLDTPERNAFIVEHWQQKRAEYGKTLVFALNRAHARGLADLFTELRPAPRVGVVLGETAARDRDERIEAFRDGELDVLINVEVFTEGFDCPDVRTILLTRPTLSPTLYLQMVGRGTRIAPGKSSFFLVDFEDQLGEFQTQMIRPWVLGPEFQAAQLERQARPQRTTVDLPPALERVQRYDPVSLSDIAGYVIFTSGPGDDDGFFVHQDDEARFLELWSAVEADKTDANVALARTISNLPALTRVPRARLVAALAALQEGAARYVPLWSAKITEEIRRFLAPAGFDADDELELTRQLHAVWALGRYFDDELSDEMKWFPVFQLEAEAWRAATRSLDDNRSLRGEERRKLLSSIYESTLEDTVASEHQWERFATQYTRNPREALLILERPSTVAPPPLQRDTTNSGLAAPAPLPSGDASEPIPEETVAPDSDATVASLAKWRPRLKSRDDLASLSEADRDEARRVFGSLAILMTKLGALSTVEDLPHHEG